MTSQHMNVALGPGQPYVLMGSERQNVNTEFVPYLSLDGTIVGDNGIGAQV